MNDSELKVLLVDDDEVDHLVTRRLLREVSRTRYDVTWLSTSDEAIDALLAGGYDVCLLDYRLDARTGLEVVHEANHLGCAIPIIMLTGVGDEAIDMAAMSAGAADYLVKGRFDAQILERTIRYAIEHKRSQLKLKQYADTLEESNRQLVQMHEELAAKNAELIRLNEEKNRFVGMAAHDLRNPLGVILGYSDFMLMTHRRGAPGSLLQEGGVEIVEMIRSSSKFMLSLINDLLDVSMIELGKLNLDRKSTDVVQLVESNVALNMVLAGQKSMRLVVESDERVPRVDVDVHKLEQVLNNLISNAIHYSPPGTTIHVRVRSARATPGTTEVIVSVQDEGPGIAPEDIGKLFRPFGRARTVSTGGERSTGLGLAIAQRIVEGHGGRIWVESVVSQGATFFVALPVSPVANAAA
ncbi:two-component hybrid sensor and regulator [Sorangium cellulosum]|uniref:histidine kinase n=1 Tax=Sorangium cellulosum TaxID=56 RepID=A0A2L0EPL4_SORCE|nr:ATP-binding protein [Sorangium cellulosum]AUX41210.1 two-component hybrid sensor and regulator [Sorangium cellulosum]